jgi:uncharacterized protein YdaU (DUF1376 family)
MNWYPRYPALWKAKTMHLDPFQDGCYLRLVDHYMETRQPLPDNDSALARIIGISVDQWGGSGAEVVRAFFMPKAGKLFNDTCDRILKDQDERSEKHTEKGKKGAEARWNKNNSLDATAIPQAMPANATGQDRTRQDKESNSHTGAAELITLPADWNPTVDHENRCRSLGHDPKMLAAAFKSNHRAKGKSFSDWDAAFDLWIGNEEKFIKPTGGCRHDPRKQKTASGSEAAEQYVQRLAVVGG